MMGVAGPSGNIQRFKLLLFTLRNSLATSWALQLVMLRCIDLYTYSFLTISPWNRIYGIQIMIIIQSLVFIATEIYLALIQFLGCNLERCYRLNLKRLV